MASPPTSTWPTGSPSRSAPRKASLAELPADAAALSSQYLPFAWAETQFQGKTYALPFDTDARALWYNKDLITAAGQDPAQLDISKGPATIETVTKIADAISTKDASGNYDVMGWMPAGPGAGGNPGAFDQGWHYTWGFVNGGKFADLAACKITPTDPGVVAGYQFMYDWAKAHDPQAVARWVTTNLPPNPPAAQNPFWTGKLAMTISGDWRIAEQQKYAPTGHYAFTYIPVSRPVTRARRGPVAGRWRSSPTRRSPIRRSSSSSTSPGRTARRCTRRSRPTCRPSTPCWLIRRLYDAAAQAVPRPSADGQSRPPLAVGAAYWDALTSAMGSVELNTKEPAAALRRSSTRSSRSSTTAGC